MNRAERKKLLLLACACDRMEWELYSRQRYIEAEVRLRHAPGWEGRLFSALGLCAPLMPGWVRGGVKLWQLASLFRR